MEKEVAERFEHTNKRIDDNKTMIQIVVSSGTAIFAVLAIVFTWNFNTEKNDLKAIKNEIKNEVNTYLGKNTLTPNIRLYTEEENPLDGSIIKVKVEEDEQFGNSGRIPVPIILRNEGRGSSGEVTVKAYTKRGIELWDKATFEKEYSYEEYWQGKENTGIPDLPPPNYSHRYPFMLYVNNAQKIETRIYQVKLKLYYGEGQTTSAEFKIDVVENQTSGSSKHP